MTGLRARAGGSHVAHRRYRNTEVFTLGTRLTRVTRALRGGDADGALDRGGTRCRTGAGAPGWADPAAFLDR